MKSQIKTFLVLAAALPFFIVNSVVADNDGHEDGLISKKSNYSVKETLDKLEAVLKKKGISIVLRWNHAEKAKGVGIPLRPTELLMFGNPKLGSHMFTANQTAGIDLPLKALAWKDEKGQVWLTYNDPAYIVKRHHIKNRSKIQVKMTGALNKLTNIATGNK
ncbi:hypothetical protein MNBD_GAMMA23-2213 [hydrothermal vent metagenome]|uniref:DUF302 domain-containing protein n=1 Tax=hydrothermal vent metagenome TaxID=652676 RepID=A0A3B1A3R2_9ZZZZ